MYTSYMNNTRHPEEHVPLSAQAFRLLVALAEKPMHGYGIIEQYRHDAGAEAAPAATNIYSLMRRLEREKLIEKQDVNFSVTSPVGRQPYQLTATGSAVLKRECRQVAQLTEIGLKRLAIARRRDALNATTQI